MEAAKKLLKTKTKCGCGAGFYCFQRANEFLRTEQEINMFITAAIMQQLDCSQCCFEKTLKSFRNCQMSNTLFYEIVNRDLGWDVVSCFSTGDFPKLRAISNCAKLNVLGTFLSTGPGFRNIVPKAELIKNTISALDLPEDLYMDFIYRIYPILYKFGGKLFKIKCRTIGLEPVLLNFIENRD
jgi:hypothetical protein